MCVEVLHLRNFVIADEQSDSGRGGAICSGRRSASTRSKSRRSRDFGGVRRLNRSFEATNVRRIPPGRFVCTIIAGPLFGATGTSWNLLGTFFQTHIHINPAASPFPVTQSADSRRASTQSVCDFCQVRNTIAAILGVATQQTEPRSRIQKFYGNGRQQPIERPRDQNHTNFTPIGS